MTLIQRLAKEFGSKTALANAIGVHPAQITRWDNRRVRKTTGSGIPYWHMPRLVAECRKRGIELSLDDFIADAPDG